MLYDKDLISSYAVLESRLCASCFTSYKSLVAIFNLNLLFN